MPNVIRDFIPDGKDPSPAEQARFATLRGSALGGARKDFIPGAGHELHRASGRRDQAREALERAMARQSSAARTDFQAGVERLRNLNVAQSIEAILQAPSAVQEMLLIAEAKNGNRKSILDRFPQVDPRTVANWESILADGPKPSDEDGPAE